MKNRSQGLGIWLLALAAVLTASCAGARNEATEQARSTDLSPTARTTVDAHVGKGLSSDGNKIETITDDFGPNETVFAVVDVPGSMDGQLQVRWMHGGTQVHEQTVTLNNTHAYSFQLDPAAGGNQAGDYELEVYVNGKRVESEKFKIKSA